MHRATSSLSQWALPAFAGTAVALALWFTFPPSPVVFNDDFGYVRSIIQTLQHGRPWTDDWLGPWAASLSVLSALVFKVTGSFRAATYGVQALFGGLALAFGIVLLRLRKLPWPSAILWTLVLASFPTVVWKTAEFGAIPLYLACLLGALVSAERRAWWLFGCFWLIGVTSRQSALLWLALPAGMLLESLSREWARWRGIAARIAAIGVGGGLVYFMVSQAMNQTNAQLVMLPSIWGSFQAPVFLTTLGIGVALFFSCVGIGGLIVRTAGGLHGTSLAVPIVATLAVFGLWVLSARNHIFFEHNFLAERPGLLYLLLLGILAVIGCWLARPSIRYGHALTALAVAAALGLRPAVWDYYLLDIAVLGLFGAQTPKSVQEGAAFNVMRAFSYGLAGFLIWFQSGYILAAKRSVDWSSAVVTLYERALRTHQIEPQDLGGAPFGYRGWHLYPYFVRNDGASGAYIADFEHYVRPEATRIHTGPAQEPAPAVANGTLQETEKVVVHDIFPFEWRNQVHFSLIKRDSSLPSGKAIDPGKYSFDAFPLNDQEWRERLIR